MDDGTRPVLAGQHISNLFAAESRGEDIRRAGLLATKRPEVAQPNV